MFKSFFISHSWKYSDDYNKIVEWFDEVFVIWDDNSIPEYDKIHTTSEEYLRRVIRERISKSEYLIVFAAMYTNHSEWINFEIDHALVNKKKIIAIIPWGQERIPQKIKDSATELVRWNKESITSAIINN